MRTADFELRPVDTWFFRDSTPFTAEATPQEAVASVFPPHPPTVAGALRAALARRNGWNGAGPWPRWMHSVIGNGPDDLGSVSFAGPVLIRNGKPLFRCPRHVLGVARKKDAWEPRVLLRPGPPVRCDLGNSVRLPEPTRSITGEQKQKPGGDAWLTESGLANVLRGQLPSANARSEEVVRDQDLWNAELRIGLERSGRTRTAVEGMLYSARHVRPGRGVSLAVRVRGVPEDWRLPNGMLPLGGESRLAECVRRKDEFGSGVPLRLRARPARMAVIAVTPLDLEPDVIRGARTVPGLGGARVVSACLGRPLRIGGWDSLASRPLPLRSYLPPGSVLFVESASAITPEDEVLHSTGLCQIGARTSSGFGLAALGIWPDGEDKA